jgi:hypothetical protein
MGEAPSPAISIRPAVAEDADGIARAAEDRGAARVRSSRLFMITPQTRAPACSITTGWLSAGVHHCE